VSAVRVDPSLTPTPQRRVRALVHLLRAPLASARLRLRLAARESDERGTVADTEAALIAADTAVARLLPLAVGSPPPLEPAPGDLVQIVVAVVRASAGASLQTPSNLCGNWDAFAVGCLLRNLLSLARAHPARPAAVTLQRADWGATLAVVSSAAPVPAGDARRWLIEQLVKGHGGDISFSRAPETFSAHLLLPGRVSPVGPDRSGI